MCPSYMATREEMHSTRGRARLLFEALTSDVLEDDFPDDALYEALDLCLSCKACKTECPAAIDMASYKADFLANYYQTHPLPLSAAFFRHIHDLPRTASITPR